MYEQLYSKTGVRAIVGSGLLWAWYDCLFMSSFFPFDRGTGFMPEFAYLLIQLACTAFYTVVVTRSDWGARLLANRWSVGFGAEPGPWASEVTTVAGYCIVIAIVLLLSSEEVFALTNGYFDYRRMVQAAQDAMAPEHGEHAGEHEELDVTSWLDEHLATFGLTAREAEVARLLAHGRTQKWIADYLCISQNTTGTHLRHIYQKVGVHNRQEFLDALARPEE